MEPYRPDASGWMAVDPVMNPDHVVHRLAIDDLLARYAFAVDFEDPDLFDTVFTPDAILDYTSSKGPRGPYHEVKPWLFEVLKVTNPARMHVIAQRRIFIDGDAARVRAYFTNPYAIQLPEGSWAYSNGGGFYDHRLELRREGWRSVELYQHTLFRDTGPPKPHPHAARSTETWDFGSPVGPRSDAS
jgi:hypothetical protein